MRGEGSSKGVEVRNKAADEGRKDKLFQKVGKRKQAPFSRRFEVGNKVKEARPRVRACGRDVVGRKAARQDGSAGLRKKKQGPRRDRESKSPVGGVVRTMRERLERQSNIMRGMNAERDSSSRSEVIQDASGVSK